MKINEKLQNDLINRRNDAIVFTTGAYLTPQKLENGKWAWVVCSFEDSTFFDGEEVNVESLWTEYPEYLVNTNEDEE